MGNTLSTAFVNQYSQDVKLAFQRHGSLLLTQVRRKLGVIGTTYTFYKIGKGAATLKSRNGLIIPMNPAHNGYSATLADRYAPEYVDALDELKISYDERDALVRVGAWALGRAADLDITTALNGATTNQVAVNSSDMTIDKVMAALYGQQTYPTIGLFARDVDDDGQVTYAVGPRQWAKLMQITQFASADYIAREAQPWYAGPSSTAKHWLNCTFLMHSGLEKSGNNRYCYCFHKNAVGQATGADISTEINYVPDRAAHLVNSMMSMGAVVIDTDGITQVLCDETQA